MVAVQGPHALEKLDNVLPFDVSGLSPKAVATGSYMVFNYIASRTGYTGEAGLEIILPALAAGKAWGFVTSPKAGVRPAGLGSRDLLRLEAGLPLYGHELNKTIDPISASLGKAVRERGGFVGAEAIAKVRAIGPARRLVGLKLEGPRIARQGALVLAGGVEAGVVSSGTFSPSCKASIAMAFVDRRFAELGEKLFVAIRPTEQAEALVVPRPFYRGSAYKKG
jgi:aminomethyltransferase